MITESQRQRRQKYLGSSDAPAIAGVNPWRNAADIYWDKINPSPESDLTLESDAIIVGNLCESAVLDWFVKETGKKIIRNQSRVHSNKIMAANFDALVTDSNEAVEAKTTGITGPLNREEWGEIDTDQVPQWIIVQCQHQMAVLPHLKVVWVPALLGGIGFRMYKVERNDKLINALETIETNFWKQYIEKKIVPTDNIPSLETIKRIERTPNKTVKLNDQMVQLWLDAKKAASDAEKAKNEIHRGLLNLLGDAEAGECSFGTVTYFEQSVKEKIIPASSYRVARFKKAKG